MERFGHLGLASLELATRCAEQCLNRSEHQGVRVAQLCGAYHAGKEGRGARPGWIHRSGKGQYALDLPLVGRAADFGVYGIRDIKKVGV